MSILQTLIVPGMAMIAALALPSGPRGLETDDVIVPHAQLTVADLSGDRRGGEDAAEARKPGASGTTAGS